MNSLFVTNHTTTLGLLLLVVTPIFADQVTMKNGDRLSGIIEKSDGMNLTIKAEFAGEVKIPWDAVTEITATAPVNVGLKDGQNILGTVVTRGANLEVTTQRAGIVTAPKDAVQSIRSKDEQAAYEAEIDRFRNPRIIDLWIGTLDLAFANSHGNANTSTFSLSGNASRATTRDKIAVYYTSLFSSSNVTGPQLTTADAKRGGIRYDLNVAKQWFVFGSVDLDSDKFQSLDLRFVPAGGIGYHAIKSERTTLDFDLGVAGNREFFSTGLNRTSAEILLGEDFTRKINGSTSITERLQLFPDVSNTGEFRGNFDLSAVTAIRKWLSWQLTFSDRYLSNPVFGRKKNDTLFTTGLRLTFAK